MPVFVAVYVRQWWSFHKFIWQLVKCTTLCFLGREWFAVCCQETKFALIQWHEKLILSLTSLPLMDNHLYDLIKFLVLSFSWSTIFIFSGSSACLWIWLRNVNTCLPWFFSGSRQPSICMPYLVTCTVVLIEYGGG